ncbi:hypothetical protein PTSG_07576 [Salpingoeca rosetta]|uniref:protein disulfide-isomerase n=1 Tax=Salpingoeca rosetta (strain ATCC 50818 / BSB-021) TaxID=946362 RepID=F2UH58_SALR5|nr:uncharacterized protein PTSG_07576 [Salpingoeca rosetta]EGD76457.1 hypothetical protein PTSG_07576 [Salpingoeca rosetta]|eukprot:XP_004991372.1 hypothetical protein PTSG_07576 [Salpingoeca rosetta]
MRTAVAVVAVVAVALLLCSVVVDGAKGRRKGRRGLSSATEKAKHKCTTCRRIVDDFFNGLEKTENDIEFRGESKGWTKDNEKFLGKYAMNEARMTVALEGVCQQDYKCTEVFAELEEDIEDWWTEERPDDTTTRDALIEWLCIDKHKYCCPAGTYGKTCKPCAGGADTPCSGHGTCSGDGFRHGNGKCKCTDNFTGPTCSECAPGFYMNECAADPNSCSDDVNTFCKNTPGSFECAPCDAACLDGCSGDGPQHCHACRDGYEPAPDGGCRDVDECLDYPCTEGQGCVNTAGSYRCETCHSSCDASSGCSGPGASDCTACAAGFERVDGACKDVNECEEFVCDRPKTCTNEEGTYACVCKGPAVEVENADGTVSCALPSWFPFRANDDDDADDDDDSSVTVTQERIDAADVDASTSLQGNITVGSSEGNMKQLNVSFELPLFADADVTPVIRSIRPVNECCGDQFEFRVARVTPTGFAVLIQRTDSQQSWGQELVAEYTAVMEKQTTNDNAPSKDEL